jgi:hypothetical protein
MSNYPAISCFCSVYGKIHCLHELVFSFLKQDYKGVKELVILNDLAEQNIIFEHPEVKVINVKEHIRPLGRKFNTNINYCRYEIISTMEVDDIYLPHHLTYAIDNMKNGIYHCRDAWVSIGIGIPLHNSTNLFHATHCYTKELVNRVGGYSESIDNTTIDVDIITKFQKILGNYSQSQKLKDISYIYRWGVGGYHTSGWGTNINNVSELAEHSIKERIKCKQEPTGDVILHPEWKQDYLRLVKEALDGQLCL